MHYSLETSLSTDEIAHRFRRRTVNAGFVESITQGRTNDIFFRGEILNKKKFSLIYLTYKSPNYITTFNPQLVISVTEISRDIRRIDMHSRLATWDLIKVLFGISGILLMITCLIAHWWDNVFLLLPGFLSVLTLKDYIHKRQIDKEAIITSERIILEAEITISNITYRI